MAGGFPLIPSVFEGVSGNPRLGVTRDGDKGFEVIETERSPVAQSAHAHRQFHVLC